MEINVQEGSEEEEKHVERSRSSHRVAAQKAKSFFLSIPKPLRLPVLFALIICVLAIPTLPMALVVSVFCGSYAFLLGMSGGSLHA